VLRFQRDRDRASEICKRVETIACQENTHVRTNRGTGSSKVRRRCRQ
jgi:hypothetical protein